MQFLFSFSDQAQHQTHDHFLFQTVLKESFYFIFTQNFEEWAEKFCKILEKVIEESFQKAKIIEKIGNKKKVLLVASLKNCTGNTVLVQLRIV